MLVYVLQLIFITMEDCSIVFIFHVLVSIKINFSALFEIRSTTLYEKYKIRFGYCSKMSLIKHYLSFWL